MSVLLPIECDGLRVRPFVPDIANTLSRLHELREITHVTDESQDKLFERP